MATSRPYFYALGKRKSAIAKVRLYPEGEGKVTVNGGAITKYFYSTHGENALAALALADMQKKVDVDVTLVGGGKPSQSDAMRLGISRALTMLDGELRTTLKHAGFLRRDSRIKERKKPGLKRARRAPQFSKR